MVANENNERKSKRVGERAETGGGGGGWEGRRACWIFLARPIFPDPPHFYSLARCSPHRLRAWNRVINVSFITLRNHPRLLCGLAFANEI